MRGPRHGASVHEAAHRRHSHGLPADTDVRLPIFETVLKGSIVGTHHDLEEVSALHALGRTRVPYETRPLDLVNEAFEDVEHARTTAPRIVPRP